MPEPKGTKGVVIIGERRNTNHPDSLPGIPHPLLLRLEERTDERGVRTLVCFEHGVTGYERLELTDHLLDELRGKHERWYISAPAAKRGRRGAPASRRRASAESAT